MIKPLQDIKVIRHRIPAHKFVPNSSISKKPLLIYKDVFSNEDTASIEAHLISTGVVTPQWRYTMYSRDHFHSTTHEVLIIAQGKAELCFGHLDNPARVSETVQKGDAIVVPAGVSHRLLEDVEGNFLMVGSYPNGKDWDMCYGFESEQGKVQAIHSIAWFERDPLYGATGPVLEDI